jgi:hypothetical protein
VDLLIDSSLHRVRAKALQDCAEAILSRAAANAAFCSGKVQVTPATTSETDVR